MSLELRSDQQWDEAISVDMLDMLIGNKQGNRLQAVNPFLPTVLPWLCLSCWVQLAGAATRQRGEEQQQKKQIVEGKNRVSMRPVSPQNNYSWRHLKMY